MKRVIYTVAAVARAGSNVAITVAIGALLTPALSSVYLLFRRDHTMWSNGLHLGLPFYQYFDKTSGDKPFRVLQSGVIGVVLTVLLLVLKILLIPRILIPEYWPWLAIAAILTGMSFSVNACFALRKQVMSIAAQETALQVLPYLIGALVLWHWGIDSALMCYSITLAVIVGYFGHQLGCWKWSCLRQIGQGMDRKSLRGLVHFGMPRMIGAFCEMAVITIGLHHVGDPDRTATWIVLMTLLRCVLIITQPLAYLHGTGNAAITRLGLYIAAVVIGSMLMCGVLATMLYSGIAGRMMPALDLQWDVATQWLLMFSPGMLLYFSLKDIVNYQQSTPMNAWLLIVLLLAGPVVLWWRPEAMLHLIYMAGLNLLALVNLWYIAVHLPRRTKRNDVVHATIP